MVENKKVTFSFGWLALKLLGKSLYSNAWSAISELVANGFDAHAKNVYVYMNIEDKSSATIEIFDDGIGMSIEDMQIYAQVGYNRREDFKKKHENTPVPQDIMGRKGIGKLAALYLSSNYFLYSKTEDTSQNCWEMNYTENAEDTNERPSLNPVVIGPQVECEEIWNAIETGTFLKLINVNLSGLGEQAFSALESKLANYFSLDSMPDKKIFLCIKYSAKTPISFKEVSKRIAFKNMAFIEYSPENLSSQNIKTLEVKGTPQQIPYSKINENYEHHIDVCPLTMPKNISTKYEGISKDGEPIEKTFSLRGWLGIHCTISSDSGKINDDSFMKNKFYNPTQLRLYVRNKLAIENFLNVINSTQTYANYIEGEINFDILDDDDFPDIATSNRQGLDEHDERVALLIKILSPIIRSLIDKRAALAQKMKDEQKGIIDRRTRNAKAQFSQEVSDEVEKFDSLSNEQKVEFNTIITNKVKGDLQPKDKYIIFFSHSSKDKCFTDFIYGILLEQGVWENEIFYTSRDDNPDKYSDITPLNHQIHECITNLNTMLFYLIGGKYKSSEFCMFEGGAGWATRSIGDYPIMAIKYEHIPRFLTNGKNEFVICPKGVIELDRETYLAIVGLINRLIDHVNAGRKIFSLEEANKINETELPSTLELYKRKEDEKKYMNTTILEHWDCYVDQNLKAYLETLE